MAAVVEGTVMLQKTGVYLEPRTSPSPAESAQLEAEGYTVLKGALDDDAVSRLRSALASIYASHPPDSRVPGRNPDEDNDFRYEMFNRCPEALDAVSHPRILSVVEPLLGEDCHIIANTCWRNPPRDRVQHGGGGWHIDAGPHIPREPGIPWDDRIPYPVFAIGVHIYVEACDLASGPTGVLPFSHKSGQHPPLERYMDDTLTYDGQAAVPLLAEAGDVALFVSDVWHRRMPTGEGDRGRFFLQVHYGRRDIAQRIKPTAAVNHTEDVAWLRDADERQKRLIGLHPPLFYDG